MEVPRSQSDYLSCLLTTRELVRVEFSTFSGETEILVLSVVMSTIPHFSRIISIWYGGAEPPPIPTLFPHNL